MSMLTEAEEAVYELNNEIINIFFTKDGVQSEEIDLEFFILVSNGLNVCVKFLGQCLWLDEDDERLWHDGEEPGDEWQEPLVDYLRKESQNILKILKKIKL